MNWINKVIIKKYFILRVILNIGEELYFGDIKVGKILIDKPFPFALVKLLNPDLADFKDKELKCNDAKVSIIEIN